jgi:hypothetical protein
MANRVQEWAIQQEASQQSEADADKNSKRERGCLGPVSHYEGAAERDNRK